MTDRTLRRWWAAAVLLTLAGCGDGAAVDETNAAVDAQLANIAAHTNETDGMDQGNDYLMATPTLGQQMDAHRQPPQK